MAFFRLIPVPLLHVLGVHYKILSAEPCAPKMWERILGIRFFPDSSLMPMDNEVPMLLRDPVTILLHLLMQLPMHVDLAYYTSMVQGIYNLVYIQILCALSCSFKESEREEFKSKMSFYSATANSNELFFLLGTVIRYLEKFPFFAKDDDMGAMDYEEDRVEAPSNPEEQASSSSAASSSSRNIPSSSSASRSGSASSKTVGSEEELETRVENLLLPYLRIASLLRHHIYEQDLPVISSTEAEFRSLAQFLGLGVGGSVNSSSELPSERSRQKATKPPSLSFFFPAHSFFSWISPTPLTTIWTWCEDLSNFIGRTQVASAQLVRSHHTLWNQPRLMELPHAYDVIFQFYHRKQCHNCNSVPKDPNICLVCGTLVCMRDTCCKQSSSGTCEAIQHSLDCGAGTVIYLSVNSSTIVVVRGRRACLWGSVYLDSFGEEDRELK
jgi:E3 ubiquitin-protein ligase UBR3